MKSIYILILLFLSSLAFSQTHEWIQYTQTDQVNSIAVFEDKTWVGTDQGLVCIDTKTNKTEYFNTANSGLPENYITKLAIENNGTIWIGTYSSGLIRFDGQNWTTFNSSNSGLPENWITSIAISTNGAIWVGTASNGIVKFDGQNWTTFNTSNSGLPQNSIKAIKIQPNGAIWSGTFNNGLTRFDQNWTTFNSSNSGFPFEFINELEIENNGAIWIGSSGSVLARFDGNQTWNTYDPESYDLTDSGCLSLAIENNGAIWIGTQYSGLSKFDGQNWTLFTGLNSGLPDPNGQINSIAIDSRGNKWIGTPNGLAVYREGGVILDTKEEHSATPKSFSLFQNYPNPFNPETTISFSLPTAGQAKITIYSILGEKIKEVTNQFYSEGVHSIPFNGSGLASGVYFYRIEYWNHSEAKRMILIK